MENESGVLINSTSLINKTVGFSIAAQFVLMRISSTIQLVLCGLALAAFYRFPSIRTEINYPIINLVASDILRGMLGLMSMSFYVTMFSSPSTYTKVFCVIFRYMNNVQLAWSGWAIVIVAYSRYDHVVNVLGPKFTRKRFWKLAVTSWIVSLLTSLPPVVGWSSYSIRKLDNMYRCVTGSLEKDLGSVTFLPLFYCVNYLLSSVLVIVLFSGIARIAISRQLKCKSTSTNSKTVALTGFSQPSDEPNRQDRRVAATHFTNIVLSKSFLFVAIIVVTNLVLLAPYVVVTSYDTVNHGLGHGKRKQIPYVVHQITTILFKVNYNVNSLLYIFWIKTFQQATGSLCCRKERRSAPSARNIV